VLFWVWLRARAFGPGGRQPSVAESSRTVTPPGGTI